MNRLTKLADMCEKLAATDFKTTPKFMFMRDLISQLTGSGMTYDIAIEIVAQMDINISSYDEDNPDWKRIINSYSTMILKLDDMLVDFPLKLIANKLSITYEE